MDGSSQEQDELERLKEQLAHGRLISRLAAALELSSHSGLGAEEALLAALNDRNFIVRHLAAHSLAIVSPSVSASDVRSSIHPDSAAPEELSADDIVRHGLARFPNVDAVSTIEAALPSAPELERQIYVHALGETRDQRAYQVVLGYLGDTSDGVRRSAVEALATLGDPRAVEPVAKALDDSSKDVALAAVDALAALGSDGRPYLDRAARQGQSRKIRRRARKHLG